MSEARTYVQGGVTSWYWAWTNGIDWQSRLFFDQKTCEREGIKIENAQRIIEIETVDYGVIE